VKNMSKRSFDVCECGDYRHQHVGGTGRCLLGSLCTPAPCSKFRFSRSASEAWRTDIESAPKDGSEVLFPIEIIARAFWCPDQCRWVLTYPVRMDYVTAPSRFALPKAQPAALPSHKCEGE
jgi:hypothetical protein